MSGISPVRRSLSQILLCGFRKEEQKYSSAGNFSYGKAGGIRSASGVYGKQQGYTVIKTDTFGPVVQMEVGAMLVGRIVNYKEAGMVFRGEEKGMFQYGGSTIVLLVKKDRVKIRQDVLERSRHGIETPVRMGEVIGHA